MVDGTAIGALNGGMTIRPDNPRLPDMLRKKSEIGKARVFKRTIVSVTKMRDAERGYTRNAFEP